MLEVTTEDIQTIKALSSVECVLCKQLQNGFISKKGHLICDDCVKAIKEGTYE